MSEESDVDREFKDFPFIPDTRPIAESQLERKIQLRAQKKDPDFKLEGEWKKFVREVNGVRIYQIDSEWMRTNLLGSWNHGGHGYVCEFIPINEIWIGNIHPDNCPCKGVNDKREISPRYFESCAIHEARERELMSRGMVYWKAHQIATELEKQIGLLPDGYSENYEPLPG